ncbi:hypothetical protein [Pseudomonas putida]|uniref:hypothetical protein n=1 Tax=Pseudomonas putida TaxID=303 RepID=UPI000A11CF87|nr:hypothetical protein [Pseudomonas putida]ORL52876.1 hypothetical protein B7H18_05225 [Pseudomonas putida]
MPTENRSSTIEQHDHIEVVLGMVSVPAAHDLASKVREAMDRQACPNAWMIIAYEAVLKNFPAQVPQPHAEPIAWMVGTAFWWTKVEAERDAAEVGLPVVGLGPMTGSSVPAVSIPDGYCLMPRRLTAENGAKALMLGVFKLEVTRECPECLELDEPAEGCEICDGEGEYAQRHTIPWDQIKFIYSEAVKGLALKPNTAR